MKKWKQALCLLFSIILLCVTAFPAKAAGKVSILNNPKAKQLAQVVEEDSVLYAGESVLSGTDFYSLEPSSDSSILYYTTENSWIDDIDPDDYYYYTQLEPGMPGLTLTVYRFDENGDNIGTTAIVFPAEGEVGFYYYEWRGTFPGVHNEAGSHVREGIPASSITGDGGSSQFHMIGMEAIYPEDQTDFTGYKWPIKYEALTEEEESFIAASIFDALDFWYEFLPGNYGVSLADLGLTNYDPADRTEVKSVPMYRLYNPNSGEHFYTARAAERDMLIGVGWHSEGVGWIAPEESGHPVYRLYNPNAGDHHYTMSKGERDMLVKIGWNDEGIGWYSDDAEGVPLYRQYNPNAVAGSHNYTTSKSENDYLASIGWKAEGIGWYGVKK